MKSKISIIKIVNQPVDKNCWLSVDDNVGLKFIYSDFITNYDFIDFEGEVFYYDVIDSLSNCFTEDLPASFKEMCIISSELFEADIYDYIKSDIKIKLIEKLQNDILLLKLENLL
jgi:hypothetical protein